MKDGQKECVAVNGNGGQGVFAVARCCTGHKAQCQTIQSPERGADAECPSEHQLTGDRWFRTAAFFIRINSWIVLGSDEVEVYWVLVFRQ